MSAAIMGLGMWVPDQVRTNAAWPASFVENFRKHNELRKAQDFTFIEKRSEARPYEHLYAKHASPYENDPFKGAAERRVTPEDVPTSQGDAVAAMRALEDARLRPDQIDLVLSSALLPDRVIPSNGPAIQHLIGAHAAAGIGVEAACSSALAQLDLAAGLVEAGRATFVLCVQTHQIARALDLTLPFSPIFGDGSTAFVVGRVPEPYGLVHLERSGMGELAGAVTWTYAQGPSTDWWRGPEGTIRPGSDDPEGARRIARHVVGFAIDAVSELCEKCSIAPGQAAAVAMIQPLVWYQPAVAEGLGIPLERAPSTYASYAHLGAAGAIANLLDARQRGLLEHGAPVILYAHGAGLTRYAAMLRWWAPST